MTNLYAQRREPCVDCRRRQAMIGNDKDYLPTRVSYKLNLRGPSVNVQTACSTSLVAVAHGLPEPARPASATWRWPAASRSACRTDRLSVPRRQHPLARRPLPAVRRRGQRHGRGNGVGVVVLKRLSRRARRRRSHPAPSSRARRSTTTARDKVGYTAPERRRARPRSFARRRRAAGVEPRHDRLRRGPRHRHAARRSDRDRGADARRSAPAPTAAASAPSARSRPTSATSTPPPASPA